MSDSPPSTDEPYRIPTDQIPRHYTWLAKWRDLLFVIQAIHGLVAARFPLPEGLLQLSQDAPNRFLWHIFYWLHRELSGGMALHEAMDNRPAFFPPYCVDLIRAGEESGQLEGALDDLQRELAERLAFRRSLAWHGYTLLSSLLLPPLVIAALMVFVAPQMVEIASANSAEPSALLRWAMAAHTHGFTYLLLAAMIATPVLWIAAEFSALWGGQLSRDLGEIAARIPVLGNVLRKRQLAHASAILARLLQAGAPLPGALRSAAEASGATPCKKAFARLASRVEGGSSLGECVEEERRTLPASFRAAVALGENSGRLPEALHEIAALYTAQCMQTARLSVEIGAPLLICFNGAIVFVVYGGFFTTLVQLLGAVS